MKRINYCGFIVAILFGPAAVYAQSLETLFPSEESSFEVEASRFEHGPRLVVARLIRSYIAFGLGAISTENLSRATLTLTIAENAGHWGSSGRSVNVYRLLEPCEDGRIAAATSAGVLQTDRLEGEVKWDVTADVRAGASCGWLISDSQMLSDAGLERIQKGEDISQRRVGYYSLDGARAAGDESLAPRLILEYASPPASTICVLGIVYSAENDGSLSQVRITASRYTGASGESDLPGEASSGPDGKFRYETQALPGGASYLVRIHKEGFVDAVRRVNDLAPGRCIRLADVYLAAMFEPVLLPPDSETKISHPSGVVEIVVPPGAIKEEAFLAVSVLPSHLSVNPLPALISSDNIFVDVSLRDKDGAMIERTEKCITIRFANPYGLPLGTKVPLGMIPEGSVEWQDARQIASNDPGGCVDTGDDYGIAIVKPAEGGGTVLEARLDHL